MHTTRWKTLAGALVGLALLLALWLAATHLSREEPPVPETPNRALALLTLEDLPPGFLFRERISGITEQGLHVAHYGLDLSPALRAQGPLGAGVAIGPNMALDPFLDLALGHLAAIVKGTDPTAASSPTPLEGPAVRQGALWHSLEFTLLGAPARAYSVAFPTPEGAVLIVALGFADRTAPEDTAVLAAIVAARLG